MKPFQSIDKKTGKPRHGGKWIIKYKAPDGTYRKQIAGSTEKDAERALRGILTDIDRGTWIDPRVAKRQDEECQYRTFGDIVTKYRTDFSDRSEAAKRTLEAVLKHVVEGVHGAGPMLPASTPIADLTPARLSNVRDMFSAIKGTLATRNLYFGYLRSLFRWAAKHPAIPLAENPTEGFRDFRATGCRRGDGIKALGKDEVFNVSDVAEILEVAFAAKNKCFAYLLKTAFLTGLRKGELFGLLWCNVDLERRTILVCRNYDRRSTKSGEDRTVPMSKELVKSLRAWKAASPRSKETDPCFPNSDGQIRSEKSDWARDVRQIAQKAGVDRPGMKRHGHGTRHFFSTQWLLQGGSDSILAKILGHTDTKLIHQTYAHFCDTDLVAAIDRIGFGLSTKASTISVLPKAGSTDSESKTDAATA